jgi:hypothetical protein
MALYDTRFGLPQGVADYLNQGLPSISGIFPLEDNPYPIGITDPILDPNDPGIVIPLYPEGDDDRGGEFTPPDIFNVRTGEPSDFEKGLKKLMQGGLGGFLAGILPQDPPEVKAIKDFYAQKFGVNSAGSVASGIMAGYNPVSGGLFGSPLNIGLQRAYQQNINMIKNTLAKKYADGDYSGTQLDEKLAELQKLKTEEQMAMEKPTIDKAKTAAPDVYKDAKDKGTLGAGGGFSTSGGGSFGGFESASSKPSGRGRQDW